jgi:hypothetical protein
MAVISNRLSTIVRSAEWYDPDVRDHGLINDFEMGPIALNDTIQGINYQVWQLTWNSGTNQFIVTPETVGAPVAVLTHANVTQATLAFDQNGHVNIAFTAAGVPKLYWYDTVLGNWTTDNLPAGTITPTICLDDKRVTQTAASDILLFYTIQQISGLYNLYHRFQRERFGTQHLYKTNVPPFIRKCGMHKQLRVQLGLSFIDS